MKKNIIIVTGGAGFVGSNLIKFEGMQLPGGVSLNGRQIYDDATNELLALREKIRVEHELPADFFIG